MRVILAILVVLVAALVLGTGWLLRSSSPDEVERASAPTMLRPDGEPTQAIRDTPGCRLTGVLLDDDGRALYGLPLELHPFPRARPESAWGDELSVQTESAPLDTTVSGGGGDFVFEHVPAGGWALFVRGGRDLPHAAYRFRISANQRAVHKVLELPRGLGLRARVLDPEGRPCLGAELRATGLNVDYQVGARSGADGRCVLVPLLAGTYRLEVLAAESLTAASRIALAGDEELLELRLAAAALLVVNARDEAGEPIHVRFELRGPTERSESGAEFRFARLTPGTYECVAGAADGRLAVVRPFRLEAGLVPTSLALVLRPGRALRLRLGGDEARLWRVSWCGTLVAQGRLEPGGEAHTAVPFGPVAVGWWSASEEAGGVLEHEEQRILDPADEAALFEHLVSR